jgi:hypothetical protein
MRSAFSFGMPALILFLVVVQSSSSKLETPATVQNRDKVQQLYGRPVSEVYRTAQDLRITASFASNGNLCQAHIGSEDDQGITDEQLNPILDELAPKDVRGEYKIGTFLDVTCMKLVKPENSKSNSHEELVVDPCVTCSGVSEDYERVKITKYGNTNQYTSVHITFQRPECKELDKER